ncbi:MAG: hypothetical protein M3O09_14530 [Acidobacteriota bacterium]|nr:hypothetical protein [Acidobacteriota bacterium]
MSTKSGVLDISGNVARLDDGTLLARCDEDDPVSAGAAFLRGLGFRTGDRIRVTGSDDQIGGVAVFCMTGAVAIGAEALISKKGKETKKQKKAPRKKMPAAKGSRKKAKNTSTKKDSRRPK